MSFHAEVLSDEQLHILPRLASFADTQGFYLGGGTAVALHLGHRHSDDFDWFTHAGIADALVLAEQVRQTGLRVEGVQVSPGTLHAVIGDVHVSFFEYPYPEISEPSLWPDCSVKLASLDDLACMKLAAVAQRGSRKDFVDIYVIALQHKPIRDLLELYKRKYSTDDIAHVLIGLAYFDDADEEPSPIMLADIPWREIKCKFRQWARELSA